MFKQILTVLSGGALGQLLLILFSPVLTRLFTSETLGSVGLIVAVSSIVGIILTMRLEMSFVISDSKRTLPKKFSNVLEFFVRMAFLALTVAVALILSVEFFHIDEIVPFTSHDVVFVFALGSIAALYSIFNYLAIKLANFKNIALASTLGPVVYIVFASLAIFLGAHTYVLVLANFFNTLSKFIVLFWSCRSVVKNRVKGLDREFIKSNNNLVMYRAPNDVVSAVSQNIPVFVLATFFGASPVGYYWLCSRVLRLPATIISDAIKKVVLNKVSSFEGDIKKAISLSKKLTFVLFLGTLLPCSVIIAFGPELFGFTFGEEWTVAGKFASIISIWVVFLICNVPTMALITCFDLQKILLSYETAGLILRTMAMVLTAMIFDSAHAALSGFVFVAALTNVALITHVHILLKQKLHRGDA